MFKKLLTFLFFLSFFLVIPQAYAQEQVPQPVIPQQSYVKGKVVAIVKEGIKEEGGTKNLYQVLKVQLLEGKEQGKTITVQQGGEFALSANQKAKVDSTVIVMISKLPQQPETYAIYDTYRLTWAIGVVLSLFAFIILIAGKRGIGATAGLLISLLIIWLFIVPEVLGGGDPLVVAVIWSCVILLTTTYIAHGISKATTLAIISTFISLLLTIILSILFVNLAHLAGLGNEDAVTLQFNQGVNIDLKGLLLGGIIIGTLGALNDVTTTQVATIFALAKTGVHKSKLLLAEQSFQVGSEHIISLVNTLVLASIP